MKAKLNYNVAIYCRLSREDEEFKESNSITNQKAFITEYVTKKGWRIFDYYIDDGYTGTSFNRPGFKRMIQDIEEERIDLVITKDLSRLGRNYITSGYYIEEYFPKKNIRYIAINDNYDSINGDSDDFVPLKNVINEFYAKDISKKVRATKNYQQKKGIQKRSAYPLYGYAFNQEGQRIINPETALIVKRIYHEFLIDRKSLKEICQDLRKEKVLTPAYYNYFTYGKMGSKINLLDEEKKYNWKTHTVETIISTIDYTGCLVTAKTTKISFKIHNKIKNKKDDRYYFEDAFEPIIDKNTYQQVQELRNKYKYAHELKLLDPLRGLCYCASCKKKLVFKKNQSIKRPTEKGTIYCKNTECVIKPRVTNEFLHQVLFEELKQFKEYFLLHQDSILQFASNIENIKKNIPNSHMEEIELLNKEFAKYDVFLKKLFELYGMDHITLSEYNSRSKEYRDKQIEIQKRLDELLNLKTKIENIDFVSNTKRLLSLFINSKLDSIEDMKEELILSLINKIYIGQKKTNKRYHANKGIQITIEYKYADEVIRGFIYEQNTIKQQDCGSIHKTI